jgi:hypothetical protein
MSQKGNGKLWVGAWPVRWGLVWILLAGAAAQRTPSSEKDIVPILSQKCYQCHGQNLQMSNLDLRTREAMLKGGAHGPVIVPGNAEASILYKRLTGQEKPAMPMAPMTPLTAEELAIVKEWINNGAPLDAGLTPSAPLGVAKGSPHGVNDIGAPAYAGKAITAADRQWWSFQKPVRHPVPRVNDAAWSRNPIDAFLMKTFIEKGLQPAPPADRRTLIRRAYLDVIGLLPSEAAVEAFVNDASPNAFEKVVDGLLASPHYGERWGRHWLDVVRYGDSRGYEHDFDYPDAWRYRDYVIKSFNDDKPYDQFIKEQLAGDELDHVTPETLIATGFARIGPQVGFREKDNPSYRYQYLDDIIGTTSRGFLGLTINCARCHDHKFDPIRQMDYYRMMAVFFPYINYDYPLAPPEKVAEYQKRKAEVEAQIKPLRARLREIEKPYRKIAFEKLLAKFPEDIQIAVRTPEEKRTPGQKLLAQQIVTIQGGDENRPASGVARLMNPTDKAEWDSLQAKIKEIQKQMPEPLPSAMGIRDGDYRFAPDGPGDEEIPGKGEREVYNFKGTYVPEPGKPYVPPPAFFLIRGDMNMKGPEVQPGFPLVLTTGKEPAAIVPRDGRITTGRRRALAEWIASPENPLTARVMVNRIWQHHFGQGIVLTASNYGRMGTPPTHPELLDWLATEFIRQGWSIKKMTREMMLSRAYQMDSHYQNPENMRKDPTNQYLWKFRQVRLEAEIIRDIVLSASGQLNLKAGGPPFFPSIPESVRAGYNKGRWEMAKDGPDLWRRSVYSYWKRGLHYPLFEVLDLPDNNVTCERRDVSTVATQALTLMNNEFILRQARLFAERVQKEAGSADLAAQIRKAYRIALSRDPNAWELEQNLAFLRQQQAYHAGRAKVAGSGDAKAAPASDASVNLEALTDFCDVMLNLNEFVYSS